MGGRERILVWAHQGGGLGPTSVPQALPAAGFPGPTVSPCGPGSAPLTWALDRCLRGGRPMPRGRVSGTAVSTQRMPEASLPALTAKDPRGRNPLLEAQRWGKLPLSGAGL